MSPPKSSSLLRRLMWRPRAPRLLLACLCALGFYCLLQGPTTPPGAPDLPASLGHRSVLQRANSSSAAGAAGSAGDLLSLTPKPHVTEAPLPQPRVQAHPAAEDEEAVRSVLETDVGRDSVLPRRHQPAVEGATPVAEPEEEEQPPLDYDVEELEQELDRRRRRVREVCEATGLDKQQNEPNAWEFFVDHRHHLVWCNVFKAASSTWMYNFNLLAGYKEDYLRRSRKTPLVLARARFPRPSVAQLREALPSYLSFMIVRDPFERLLSAYRNKIESFRHKFYRKMAREMITKYRKPGSPYEGLKGPSFSEFVMHVVDTNDHPDEHWAPYYNFCTPCQVNFTVIAQMETLSRDQEFVIRHAGLAEELAHGSRGHRESLALNKARGAPTGELLERYFRQLSREQLMALYRIYRIDFDMFGYDADKYFRMLNEPEPGIK